MRVLYSRKLKKCTRASKARLVFIYLNEYVYLFVNSV